MRFELLTTWWSQVVVLIQWLTSPIVRKQKLLGKLGHSLEWQSIAFTECYWSKQLQDPPTPTQVGECMDWEILYRHIENTIDQRVNDHIVQGVGKPLL